MTVVVVVVVVSWRSDQFLFLHAKLGFLTGVAAVTVDLVTPAQLQADEYRAVSEHAEA